MSTLDLPNLPRTPDGKVDYAQDFFGREAFLTVSGQLNIEAYCLALTNVYTFGPTSRNMWPALGKPCIRRSAGALGRPASR